MGGYERGEEMIIKYECSDCESVNQAVMAHWKWVRNGQGFKIQCDVCEAEVEVDIEVNVRTV